VEEQVSIPDSFGALDTLRDGVMLHFVGQDLIGAVSSRPNAAAYRVALRAGQGVEEALPRRFLGG
jgi:hypothetical protein